MVFAMRPRLKSDPGMLVVCGLHLRSIKSWSFAVSCCFNQGAQGDSFLVQAKH